MDRTLSATQARPSKDQIRSRKRELQSIVGAHPPKVLRRPSIWYLVLITLSALSGCASTESRRSNQYNEICQRIELSGDDTGNSVIDSSADDRMTSESFYLRSNAPSRFTEGTSARDIAQARGYLAKVRRHYAKYECDHERINRERYDRPLIFTAIAATGAALAKANPYVIGGIGLVAGSIATFKSYEHPDVDRDAFLEAYKELTCAYDETHSLRFNLSVEKLIYDRKLLQESIQRVSLLLSQLPNDSATSQEQAVAKAAKSALDAGNATLTSIKGAVDDYSKLATTLYRTVDGIDIAARLKNTTNGTYTSFDSSIKAAYAAAGKKEAASDEAKTKVVTAEATEAVASEVKADKPKAGKASPTDNVIASLMRKGVPLVKPTDTDMPSDCVADDKECERVRIVKTDIAIDSTTKLELRASLVASTTEGEILKLLHLARIANDDLPTPPFADIIANLTACVPKS